MTYPYIQPVSYLCTAGLHDKCRLQPAPPPQALVKLQPFPTPCATPSNNSISKAFRLTESHRMSPTKTAMELRSRVTSRLDCTCHGHGVLNPPGTNQAGFLSQLSSRATSQPTLKAASPFHIAVQALPQLNAAKSQLRSLLGPSPATKKATPAVVRIPTIP